MNATQNNKSWNDKKSGKKLHIQKYPRNNTIDTVSSYALSVHVNLGSYFFEDQCIYDYYTSLH